MVGKFYGEGAQEVGNTSAVEMPDQHFGKARRLLKNADFQRVYSEGLKQSSPYITLHWMKAPKDGNTRIGISVSRKTGIAVLRNRVKRRLRDLLRTYPQAITPGYWVVVAARRECEKVDISELRKSLYQLINESLT